MSIPPQTIRVKRKRDNETPVTFLQFDGPKRHRTGSNWVYQRRDGGAATQTGLPAAPRQDVKPVIHVSKPADEDTAPPGNQNVPPDQSQRKKLSPRPSLRNLRPEPRRFHLSKAAMTNLAPTSGVSKRARAGPAVFVERSRKRSAARQAGGGMAQVEEYDKKKKEDGVPGEPERKLKKPATTRVKPQTGSDGQPRAPLPPSVSAPHAQDMDRITADMNQWVLNEIGANLEQMETEKKREEKSKLRPKAPAKRYKERHPEDAVDTEQMTDTPPQQEDMSEDDEGNDSDWVIDEYVRVPAESMAMGLLPGEVGVLVLEGEEDDMLFFGPEHDDEDDLEDDEDENAENHYTADYPEEEVNTDDEYNQHAYYYRNKNASDDEEFDEDTYSDDNSDEMVMEGDGEDGAMARFRTFLRQKQDSELR